MKVRKYRYFMCDFETTVYKGQEYTEVWCSACVELFTEEVHIFHSISEQFNFFKSLKCHICCFYHNLKFDGSFWLSYLLKDLNFKQAYIKLNKDGTKVKWLEEKYMLNNTFKYSISEMGQWYNIIIKVSNFFIEIRDSLKLLPFSVDKIGKSFNTKHKKLDMEYTGFRYSGCNITEDEKKYISNDVLVVKEALELMFQQGHTNITIGSCCLAEFKKIMGKEDYNTFFPNLTEISLSEEHTYKNVDEWIRKSYKGGWCYLAKGKENKVFKNGITLDVNSLYPSMMSSESKNLYPIGKPNFWCGNYIDENALKKNRYYFVRIKTRFYLKKNKLPFVQIKNNYLYKGNECLETSDVFDKCTCQYYTHYYTGDNVLHDTRVELTLTMVDFELLKEHYELVDFEIIDGCWFYTALGLFDLYMEKYKKIKLDNTGALRELAKLFLNNLYGKLASNDNSSFKVAYINDKDIVSFISVPEHEKKSGYIAIGSAITSYARNFTIRTAQKNYKNFIYADTDSIHCNTDISNIKGVRIHDKDFCCWKLESKWDVGIFVRQKTYIEHVTNDGEKEIEPFYNIKCAGMPKKCKDLFIKSITNYKPKQEDILNEDELAFITKKRTIEDFKIGLKIPSKLLPKRIKGGVLLVETTYEMR